jgi:hypothetical protein
MRPCLRLALAAVVAAPLLGSPLRAADPPKSESWVVAERDEWFPVLDGLGEDLQAAREDYLAAKPKRAADKLRAGAKYLRAEAKTAPRPHKDKLIEAAAAMGQLALDVADDKVETVKDLDARLATGYRADIEHRWAFVRDTSYERVAGAPQTHFKAALAAFGRHELKTAGVEIRKSSAYVRLQASRGDVVSRGELNAAADKLDRLAVEVESGMITDAKMVSGVFRDSQRELAVASTRGASKAWAAKKYKEAGYALHDASLRLQDAEEWTSAEARGGSDTTVQEARRVGRILINGGRRTARQFDKAFDGIEKKLRSLI